jgi:hypothetical protein
MERHFEELGSAASATGSDLAIGHVGWAAIAGLVAAWDIWAALTGKETLSGAYRRSLSSPVGRVATTIGTTYLVLHLQGWPRPLSRVDPLNVAGRHLRQLR